MPAKVTTVIPVYNGTNYLRHTLDSLAKQTRLPDRIIVINDCSTDPLRFRSNYRHVADVIFYTELASIAPKIWKTECKLIQIRQHDGNATSSNKKNIRSWVIDEWRAMKLIAEMIPENTLSRAIRRQKLKCMFAARSIVKQQNVHALDPKYADQIETEVRKYISPRHFALGRLAVKLYRPTKPSTK